MSHSEFRIDSKGFFWFSRPNRSLTPKGRSLWMLLIGANTLVIACMAFFIGAWPVLPFAGLELMLVATAFWVIGLHDADYESLEVADGMFFWERSDGKSVRQMRGNLAWAQFESRNVGNKTVNILKYAGLAVDVGTGLTEEGRIIFAEKIGNQIRRARMVQGHLPT